MLHPLILPVCFVSQLHWRKQFGRGLTATQSAGLREHLLLLWSNASIAALTWLSTPWSRATPNTAEVRPGFLTCIMGYTGITTKFHCSLHPSPPLWHAEFEPLLSWQIWLIPQEWSSTDPSLVYPSTMTTECFEEQLCDNCLTLLLGTWYAHTPTERNQWECHHFISSFLTCLSSDWLAVAETCNLRRSAEATLAQNRPAFHVLIMKSIFWLKVYLGSDRYGHDNLVTQEIGFFTFTN